jgi:hypothetical protein
MTYNQILTRFEELQIANPFLKRFGAGDISQMDSILPESIEYPFMWVVPQNMEVGDHTITYRFRVLIFDQDSIDDSHQQEILSDTLRICQDIISNFRSLSQDDVQIDTPIQCIPFTERFVDYVAGWYFDINIIADSPSPDCDPY